RAHQPRRAGELRGRARPALARTCRASPHEPADGQNGSGENPVVLTQASATPPRRKCSSRGTREPLRWQSIERKETLMNTILLIVLLVLLFGGGGGYYWSRHRR